MNELIEDIAYMLGYIEEFAAMLVDAVRHGDISYDNAQLIAQAYDERYGSVVGIDLAQMNVTKEMVEKNKKGEKNE